jgi:hypothetical protein
MPQKIPKAFFPTICSALGDGLIKNFYAHSSRGANHPGNLGHLGTNLSAFAVLIFSLF